MSNRRTTGKHPDECQACYGLGQNEKCATVMEPTHLTSTNGQRRTVLKTTQIGSGCLKCGGTGRVPKK